MSGAGSRRKGAVAERAFVAYLNAHGFPWAERRLSGGADDKGDTTGHPGLVHEVKNHKTIKLAEWVDQLADEMAQAKADVGAVIVKRTNRTNVGDWYAVMPVDVFNRLVRQAGHGEPIE